MDTITLIAIIYLTFGVIAALMASKGSNSEATILDFVTFALFYPYYIIKALLEIWKER